MKLIFLIVIFINCTIAKFVLEEYKMCDEDNKNYLIRPYVTIRNVNNKQYVDFNATFTEDIGDNFWVDAVAAFPSGYQIMRLSERDPCKFFNRYVGELWYAVQRAARITPQCPLKKGIMRGTNFFLDFSRMTIQAFPFGKLNITLTLLDKTKRNNLACITMIINSVK